MRMTGFMYKMRYSVSIRQNFNSSAFKMLESLKGATKQLMRRSARSSIKRYLIWYSSAPIWIPVAFSLRYRLLTFFLEECGCGCAFMSIARALRNQCAKFLFFYTILIVEICFFLQTIRPNSALTKKLKIFAHRSTV